MKVRQRVQVVYKWVYLFLAVDVRRGMLVWSWIDSMRSEDIAVADLDDLKCHTDLEALVMGWCARSPWRDGAGCRNVDDSATCLQS